jgi:hypothetical protein
MCRVPADQCRARPATAHAMRALIYTRERVEIMGPVTYEIVGKSQSLLIMTNPIISTRTRIYTFTIGTSSEWKRPVAPHTEVTTVGTLANI